MGIRGELLLAVPATITVLVALYITRGLTNDRILFASLAASAFLVYSDPGHRMNRVRVMLAAQIIGCLVGVLTSLLLGPGYAAAALGMVVTILILIGLEIMHPPAISTVFGFAFVRLQGHVVPTFLLALLIIASLAVLQPLATRILRHIEARGARS